MFIVCVTFQVKEKSLADFLPLMLANARASLELEPDCHQFDVCQDTDDPARVFLYEVYTDKAAFYHHLNLPHFAEFSEAVKDMVVDKKVETFTRIEA